MSSRLRRLRVTTLSESRGSRSVGQLFLNTPRTSKFDALNDEEKDAYLREQALLLAEADEDKFAKKEWGDVCNGLRTDYKIVIKTHNIFVLKAPETFTFSRRSFIC